MAEAFFKTYRFFTGEDVVKALRGGLRLLADIKLIFVVAGEGFEPPTLGL
jgi:hypothetical protein